MSVADLKYSKLILDIYENGSWNNSKEIRAKYADGTPATAKSLLNVQLKYEGNEVPILTQKRVPLKDPVKEMLWIWQMKSNVVEDLRKMGSKVWNEWEQEDGTIGKSYGWQLKNKKRKVILNQNLLEMIKNNELSISFEDVKNSLYEVIYLDQVDYLLYMLKTNPHSNRIKTTLWCVEDLDDMALEPCVYETHWQIWDGKLCLTVNIRSNDLCLGNPYNVYQYYVLHRMIAQVTGYETGELCFNIDNAHVYSRHWDKVLEQVQNESFEAPEIKINSDVKSFYDFTFEDVEIVNYKHSGTISYEIAI